MIKLRHRKTAKMPEIMISPMIDMVFLLLVFFILGTMYMAESKTIELRLPSAQNARMNKRANFTVTVKEDGSFLLGDQPAA